MLPAAPHSVTISKQITSIIQKAHVMDWRDMMSFHVYMYDEFPTACTAWEVKHFTAMSIMCPKAIHK